MLALLDLTDGSEITKSGTRAQVDRGGRLEIGNKNDSTEYAIDILSMVERVTFIDISEERNQKLIETVKKMINKLTHYIIKTSPDDPNRTFICGRLNAMNTVLEMLEDSKRLDQLHYLYSLETN